MIQKFQRAEKISISTRNAKYPTKNMKDFIVKNFQIPDDDLERICDFINEDFQLEKIIYDLPALIQSEIHYNCLQIKFYDEFQEDELMLEVTAFTQIDMDSTLKTEEKFIHNLYNNYPEESADKILVFVE